MVLATGSPQTCVAVSEKFKVILCGGKDRKIRVWNPLTGTQLTQFTCFTSTPVQILTPEALERRKRKRGGGHAGGPRRPRYRAPSHR